MSVATYNGTEWMLDASCLNVPDFTELPVNEQVAICRTTDCPVRFQCLECGVAGDPANASSTVVYGGVYPSELVKLARGRERLRKPSRGLREGRHSFVCARCHLEFTSDSHRARYCSRTCQEAARVARRLAEGIAAICKAVGQ